MKRALCALVFLYLTCCVSSEAMALAEEQSEHTSTPSETERPAYLGPSDVVASPDRKTLYVVNADARQVAVVDVDRGAVLRSISVPAEPTDDACERLRSADPKDVSAVLHVTC